MVVLVASSHGCRVFTDAGEGEIELPGRPIGAMAAETGGNCLVVAAGREIWRRSADGQWSQVQTVDDSLVAIVSCRGKILAATQEPALFEVPCRGEAERLTAFDTIEGRSEWFSQGPPLHVRALTATADGGAVMAAVHVGGIPRSLDGGQSWAATIAVQQDVHEVRAHRSRPEIVACATAYGLSVSEDGGRSWTTYGEGLEVTHGLAVAVLDSEVLFSVQSDPFAERSQIWRFHIAGKSIEQVRDGLPQWLDGKVDTLHIAAGGGRAAIVDQAGNLWLSRQGSAAWQCIATDIEGAYGGLLVL